ncbi:MAG: MazG nucleotide pyrophosphohydrolase domain-containing protein [Bacteroidia bacterium]
MYELGDAILDKNIDEIKKELSDIMLHLVFLCIADTINGSRWLM